MSKGWRALHLENAETSPTVAECSQMSFTVRRGRGREWHSRCSGSVRWQRLRGATLEMAAIMAHSRGHWRLSGSAGTIGGWAVVVSWASSDPVGMIDVWLSAAQRSPCMNRRLQARDARMPCPGGCCIGRCEREGRTVRYWRDLQAMLQGDAGQAECKERPWSVVDDCCNSLRETDENKWVGLKCTASARRGNRNQTA